MAKKKATPIIKRSVGKDKVIRFFKNGKPFSNKDNQAASAFINQDFDRLDSSPSAQDRLTDFEQLVLRNTRNSRKGAPIISVKAKISSAKRYRIKGQWVSQDVANTINFNPSLKVSFRDKNLNNEPLLKNVSSSKEALDILADMVVSRLTRKPVQVIIDNDDFIQFNPTGDNKFKRTRIRPEGTFSRPIEVLDLLDSINEELKTFSPTEPPTELKVISPQGLEFVGEDAYEIINDFIIDITDTQRTETGVAALFFFPYKYISPFLIVDLREYDEDDDAFFVEQSSELPRIRQAG